MAVDKHLVHPKSNVLVNGKPKLPTASDILVGEIAVNYKKGHETLSIKNDEDEIVTFTNDQALIDVEQTVSAALNDLEERKSDKSDLEDYAEKATTIAGYGITDAKIGVDGKTITLGNASVTPLVSNDVEQTITEVNKTSTSPVSVKAVYDTVSDTEQTISASLNDLDDRKADKSDLDDYAEKATTLAGYGITDAKIGVDGKTITLGSDSVTPLVSNDVIQTITDANKASTSPVSVKAVHDMVADNERVISASLNDLEERKADKTELTNYVSVGNDGKTINIGEDSVTPLVANDVQQTLGESNKTSTAPVSVKAVYDVIEENENTIAASLNDLNDNKADKSDLDDYAEKATTIAGYGITDAKIGVDGKTITLGSDSVTPLVSNDVAQTISDANKTSTAPASVKSVYDTVKATEQTIAASLNDLNDNKADKSDLDDYAEKATTLAGYGITDAKIGVDGKTITLGSDNVTPLVANDVVQTIGESNKTSTAPVSVKAVYDTVEEIEEVVAASLNDLEDRKVEVVSGKGLSTNDYTDAEKTKLGGISTGATKVEASSTNGNILVDNVETTVYTLSTASTVTNTGVDASKPVTSSTVYGVINANELVISAALTDLNSKYTQLLARVEAIEQSLS
ncbi:MAG: hypothetical protein J6Y37_17540 [Paludibacteraceae bacterium]|nr:hypothetical protein [Paludibacteraceae bacterium]